MKKTLGEYLIETYGENAIELYWSEKNTLSPYDYAFKSHKKIWIKCQNNKNHEDYDVQCSKFTANRGCPYCSSRRIDYFDSFGYYIESEFGKEYLEKIWSKKNKKSPYEYGKKSNLKAWFVCENVKYHNEYQLNIASFSIGRRCPYCSSQRVHVLDSFAQYHINNTDVDFLDKYWDYEKNKLDPYKISINSGRSIYIKCQNNKNHGSYYVPAAAFTKGRRCGFCSGTDKTTKEESLGFMYTKSLDVWSERNDKTPFDYRTRSGKRVYWKCENGVHEDYEREINNQLVYDFKCPDCIREKNESAIQEKTRLFLIELGLTILHENKCSIVPKNPKTMQNMPFDNEVNELKLIIEVHGSQHYNELTGKCSWTGDLTPEQYLHKRKLYDRYKRFIAHINGYHYLEIPYWEFDDDTYKQTILNKIELIRIKGE